MATTSSLSNVYGDVVRDYEELHRQGKLKDEELALIKGNANVGDVLKDVDRAKAKNELGRGAITKLIHRVTPDFVAKLERFSKIVEVAIQSNPAITALVWSGIKFVVLISQDIFNTYDRICDIMEKISLCLERFTEIVDICGGVTELLGSRLATFYGDIMEFCLKTTKFYARSKWRTIVASFSRSLSEPFDELLRKIHSHTKEIDKAAAVEYMKMTRNILVKPPNIPNSPLSKIFLVPDLLHRFFTGRVKQLQQLREMLENSPSGSKRVSVFGMPGVGKTQLALKHAHESINLYKNVFYVQATEREKLVHGYETIYGLLQLPEPSPLKQELKIEGVKQWLCNNSSWLIVFDNVVHIATVREFLPANATGSVFFTMRDRNMARELGLAGTLELLPMEEADGVELILKVSGGSAPSTDSEVRDLAIELNRELGGLPLALEQGASFANDRRWPLKTYLDRLRAQKSETLKLETGNDNASHSSFYSSFRIVIQGITPEAVVLLKILSHLDHQDIPLELFEHACKASELADFLNDLENPSKMTIVSTLKRLSDRLRIRHAPSEGARKATHDAIKLQTVPGRSSVVALQSLVSDMDELEKAVSCLQASALIRRKEAGNIWMHDLIRDMSEDLVGTGEKKLFAASAIVLMESVFPSTSENHETWGICELFASHSASAFRHAKSQEIPLLEVNNLASYLGGYYSGRYRNNEALEWYGRALAGREKALGKDHPDTLTMVHSMASVFRCQGEYSKALEWYGRALAGREKALGKDHPDTLTTVHSMASVFRCQGEYIKALEWYGRALAGYEKALGKDHPDTLTTVQNMASVFQCQGEYSKALEWYGRALAGYEKALGKDYPDTLTTVQNMALVFQCQGEYIKALEWYGRALAGYEKALGKGHPSTLTTVQNMASVFRCQGEYIKALEWYGRALAGREKALGKDHPDTLSTASHIRRLQGILKVAEEEGTTASSAMSGTSNL